MRKFLTALVVLALLGGLFVGGLMIWAKTTASLIDLPPLEASGTTVVLAADGKTVIGQIASAEAGKPLEGKDISPLVRNAHFAAEDRGFYTHGAISLTGLGWAMLTNAKSGSLSAGGSTIIQQLAKRAAKSEQRTIGDKINELPYAYRIEQDYSDDEIIRIYCNANYYGRGAYGIEDAARTWFGVHARDIKSLTDPLQVARAAFLAGLVKSPSEYDDYLGKTPSKLKNADAVWGRTRYVLDGFREVKGTGDIPSAETIQAAKALLPLKLTDTVKSTGNAVSGDPYIMQYIRDWMVAWQTELARKDRLDDVAARKEGLRATETLLAQGGLRIQTDINPTAQAALVQAHKNRLGGGPSGFVVLDPRNGGIIAMSGGRNYKADPLNYAVYANRPPGSTMKAFVLADAVKRGVSVQSVFAAPKYIKIDGPAIWDSHKKDAPGCKLTLADAIAESNNPVHVEMITGRMASCEDRSRLTKIGDGYPVSPATVAKLMHEAGADASAVPGRDSPTKIGEEARLAIGSSLEISPLKLGVMASTLANGGKYHKPSLVREISSIYEREDDSRDVIDEKYTRIVNQTLTGVFTHGTATESQIEGHPLAGKTGTTDEDQGDAWGFAYNAINSDQKRAPAGVCAGWAGKNANRAGADVMRVCQGVLQALLKGTPTVNFPKANLNDGKVYGIKEPVNNPPPPVVTTKPTPSPTSSLPTSPSTEPTKEVTTPTTSESHPEDPPSTKPTRSVPPPENGGGVNDGTVPVPTRRPTG